MLSPPAIGNPHLFPDDLHMKYTFIENALERRPQEPWFETQERFPAEVPLDKNEHLFFACRASNKGLKAESVHSFKDMIG